MKPPTKLTPATASTASAAKDARLPKGVTLAEGSKDALFVLSPSATTFASAVAELPEASATSFDRVFVHPEAARETGMLAKLKPRREIPLAVRASALLARGYKTIEATEIDGLEWVSGSPS